MVKTILAAALAVATAWVPGGAQTPDGAPVVVDLETVGGRLVVPVAGPGGERLRLALGTGTPVTVLSASAARRLGEAPRLHLGGVGGVPVAAEGIRTVPDEDLASGSVALDGMIGSNTLNRYDVLIDAPGGRLVLRPAGSSAPWEGVDLSEPVRLRVYHGVVLGLDVVVGGREYPAILDLGSPTFLVNEAVEAAGDVASGRAATVGLGGATFTDVPARVSDHPVIGRFSPSGDGFVIVGAPVALECAISLSWVRRELRTCVR